MSGGLQPSGLCSAAYQIHLADLVIPARHCMNRAQTKDFSFKDLQGQWIADHRLAACDGQLKAVAAMMCTAGRVKSQVAMT